MEQTEMLSMAWDIRENGRRYYYRTFRKAGGGYGREYLGHGPEAEREAEKDRLARERAEQERGKLRKVETRLAADLAPFHELAAWCDLLVTAGLLATNHYLHKGQWRKRHGRRTT